MCGACARSHTHTRAPTCARIILNEIHVIARVVCVQSARERAHAREQTKDGAHMCASASTRPVVIPDERIRGLEERRAPISIHTWVYEGMFYVPVIRTPGPR